MRSKTTVEEFDPTRVRPLPDQPRKRFRGIRELADSITEIGQSQPGIVTPVLGDKAFDAQLVDGEPRLRACRMAGVPFRAEVRPDADATEIFAASFGSNFGKQDHDAVEIAHGCGRLRDAGKTIDQIARIAGKSPSWVSMHLSLLRLHPDVLAMMIVGDDGEIYVNTNYEHASSVAQVMETMHKVRYVSSGDPDHLMLHEAGHYVHRHTAGIELYTQVRSMTFTAEEAALVAKHVSTYAATQPIELIAEVFAAMLAGRKFPMAILALYKRFGGP